MHKATLAVVLFIQACRFDSSTPADVVITCVDGATCPNGLRCQQSNGRCVSEAAYDDVPPQLTRSALQYVPLLNNPLAKPTAMGPFTSVALQLSVSERLSQPPDLQAFTDAGLDSRVSCRTRDSTDTAFDFECTTVASPVGGDALLQWRVALSDLARNVATEVLPFETVLDLTAPAPPDTADAGLDIRDSPWGDEETASQPSTRLRANRPLDQGTVRVNFRRGNAALGFVTVDPDGGFAPFEVLRSDSPDLVEAQAVDVAGNQSSWRAVNDVLWLATFTGKIADQLYPNPHRFQIARVASAGLEGFSVTERGELDGIAVRDGRTVEVRGAATWRRLDFTQPEGRTAISVGVYDPQRSRVVRFGGLDPGSTLAQTVWEWSGIDWTLRVPTDPEGDGNPSARFVSAAAWDPQLKGIVLYGGVTDVPSRDTWLWNGQSWRRLADGPDARLLPALYFDESINALVMYGGVTNDSLLSDAWKLTENGWSPVIAPPISPRGAPAVCTAPLTATTYIIGGALDPTPANWAQTNGVWTKLPEGPSPRTGAACAFDSIRGTLVLSGGKFLDGGVSAEVWELGDAGWVDRTTSAQPSPGKLVNHHLVYDAARQMMLEFGVESIVTGQPDVTWQWSGTGWKVAFIPSRPPDFLLSTNLVFEGELDAVRSMGFSFTTGYENVWLSPQGWYHAPIAPMPINISRLAPDPAGGLLLAAGNSGMPTAVWHSQNDGGWSLLNPDAGFVADTLVAATTTATGVDLFSGDYDGGVSVTHINPAGAVVSSTSLPSLLFAVAVATPVGDAIVGLNATDLKARLSWWTGAASVDGPDLPSTLIPSGVVYEEVRHSLVVPGGLRRNGFKDNTVWEFSRDAGWNPVPVADPDSDGQPSFELFPALGYWKSGSLVVGVGLSQSRPQDAWALLLATERPAAIIRFSTVSLPAGAQLTGMTLHVVAGASSGDPEGLQGLLISVRAPGWWSPAVTLSSATADSPTSLSIPVSPQDLEHIADAMKRQGEFDLLLSPQGVNGRGFARLVVDAVALELHYHR